MRSGKIGLLAGFFCVVLLMAAAERMSSALARMGGSRRDGAELTYFPNGPWVRPFTLGRARLAADFAWLAAIQYYGRHRQSDRKYPYAETLFRTLTGLDPAFEEAYIFGALVLADRDASPPAARDLLWSGMLHNPQSWRLAFEYGFLAFLERKDSKEAAHFLRLASGLPRAPASVARLAAYAAGKAGERDLAVELWRELLRGSENEEVKRIARGYLKDLGAPETGEIPEAKGG